MRVYISTPDLKKRGDIIGDKTPGIMGQSSIIIGSIPKKRVLTNPRKSDTKRKLISYRSVSGKHGPEFIRPADLQNLAHKWHGFRILTHNPEVSRSNRLPANIFQTTRNGRFFLRLKAGELVNE